jgi:hypothetical protein
VIEAEEEAPEINKGSTKIYEHELCGRRRRGVEDVNRTVFVPAQTKSEEMLKLLANFYLLSPQRLVTNSQNTVLALFPTSRRPILGWRLEVTFQQF